MNLSEETNDCIHIHVVETFSVFAFVRIIKKYLFLNYFKDMKNNFSYTITNFTVFGSKQKVQIQPLTFLIGANGSGKSSFLKSLQLINQNGHVERVKKIDLGGGQNLFDDLEKPIEIEFAIRKGLFRRVVIHKYPDFLWEGNYNSSPDYASFEYVDGQSNQVLYADLSIHDKILIRVDFEALYKILKANGESHLLNMFKTWDVPPKKGEYQLDFEYKEDVESIVFNRYFEEIVIKEALSDVFLEEGELQSHLERVFRPFYASLKTELEHSYKLFNIQSLMIQDFTVSKRVFYPNDQLVTDIEELKNYFFDFPDSKKFFERWCKRFFGKNGVPEITRLLANSSHYTIQINGRHLTENGSGFLRILHIIIKLTLFLDIDVTKKNIDEGFLNKTFLILEEPESNLHPDFQCLLAELITDFMNNTSCYLFVETHSETLIRMMQCLCAEENADSDEIVILNFGTGKNEGMIKEVHFTKDGLSQDFFPGFYDVNNKLKERWLRFTGKSLN